jgi:hypothetical protein
VNHAYGCKVPVNQERPNQPLTDPSVIRTSKWRERGREEAEHSKYQRHAAAPHGAPSEPADAQDDRGGSQHDGQLQRGGGIAEQIVGGERIVAVGLCLLGTGRSTPSSPHWWRVGIVLVHLGAPGFELRVDGRLALGDRAVAFKRQRLAVPLEDELAQRLGLEERPEVGGVDIARCLPGLSLDPRPVPLF